VGLGGKGNEGVNWHDQNTPDSIGYVELIYAESNKIPYGNVKNASAYSLKPRLQPSVRPLPARPRKCG